jgi:hypothetical protein
MMITGPVVSETTIANRASLALSVASRAVQVTVVLPMGNTCPL